MRKDVRMGFGVGGVLLTVIIIAVLVIHRNHTNNKAVALDGGKTASTPANELAPADPAPKAPDNTTELASATPLSHDLAPAGTPAHEAPKPPQDDAAADKTGARWDALFATAEDPLKSQLTSNPPAHKSHKSALLAAQKQDMTTEAVANGQIESGSQPAVARSVPVTILAPRKAATRSESMTTHKVEPGETFVSISRAAYGDGKYFKAIVDANPTIAPEKLKPGMMIQLPPESQVKKARAAKSAPVAAASGPALATDGKTYTVQNGDSLYKIAKKLYGKGEKGGDLYALNKQVIGPDSTKLKIGMVLKLPERPTATASR